MSPLPADGDSTKTCIIHKLIKDLGYCHNLIEYHHSIERCRQRILLKFTENLNFLAIGYGLLLSLKNPLFLLGYFLIRRGEITSDVKLLPLVVETWQKKLKNKKAHHFICCLERQRCWKSNWRGRMMPSLCWGSIPTHKYNSIAWHFGELSVNKMQQYCINIQGIPSSPPFKEAIFLSQLHCEKSDIRFVKSTGSKLKVRSVVLESVLLFPLISNFAV